MNSFANICDPFEASPPESIWTGISSVLKHDMRKSRIIMFSRIAASVAVIVAAGSVFFLLRKAPETAVVQQETQIESGIRESSETVDKGEPVTAESEAIREPVMLAATQEPESEPEPGQEPEQPPTMEDPGAGFSILPGLPTVQGMAANRLETHSPEYLQLMAHTSSYSRPVDMNEGIDVFEEWDDLEPDSYDRWAVGTQVTPLYTYRTVSGSTESTQASSYFNNVEDGMIAYAGGVNVNFSPLKRLALQSGLYYSKMGLRVEDAVIAQNDDMYRTAGMSVSLLAVSNSSGSIQLGEKQGTLSAVMGNSPADQWETASVDYSELDNYTTTQGDIIQHFEYLELPMILKYRMVDRRIGFNLLGGFSTNFLVGRDAYFQQDGEKEFLGTTGGLKPVNYSSVLGVGLDYAITSRLYINFEPTFRYYLNSINISSTIRSHPYSIGFYTGLSYSF